MEEIKLHARPGVTKILVGNKSDLEEHRKVSYEEGAVSFSPLTSLYFFIGLWGDSFSEHLVISCSQNDC